MINPKRTKGTIEHHIIKRDSQLISCMDCRKPDCKGKCYEIIILKVLK